MVCPIHNSGIRIVAMAAVRSEVRGVMACHSLPEQFRILRQKGTEDQGSGECNKFFGVGTYLCAGCGTPLYRSATKFNSPCGWPSFY
ncbi:hypothetical protein RND71_041555 [Anisodus tanguticus]|uniref:MsrB domain-containing protein n=1 Tax=Anisodus tanguticus TaxID=243964 RepID=A0AAE1QUZ6_9SOLA|nr:hypothetical protein RND71_041555 [Anisodus tanguticus]